MIKHENRICEGCNTLKTFKVKKPNHILHLILSVLTGGVWLVVYGLAAIESWASFDSKCNSCKSWF